MTKDASDAPLKEPILSIDRTVHDAFAPYQKSVAVKALARISDAGDQPQLRLLSGGVLAVGLVTRNPRMIRAGVRMLLAHETATALKNAVKHRIDRVRPRSASTEEEATPKPGNKTSKEDTSFPSGHSAGAMAVARAFAAEYPAHGGKATAAASFVALAQIPRCAHYPSDVAAGLTLGAVSQGLVAAGWRLLFGKRR